MRFRLWHAFCPTVFSGNSAMHCVSRTNFTQGRHWRMEASTRITEADQIGGKVNGWVRVKSMLLMAILCVGAPATVFGQRATIYGQVILEDGTPFRESIQVYMACTGQPIRHSFRRFEGSPSINTVGEYGILALRFCRQAPFTVVGVKSPVRNDDSAPGSTGQSRLP